MRSSTAATANSGNQRLQPEVNRIIYVRSLPFKITPKDLYGIFSRYGPIRQIRKGVTPETKGTAFVVYEDIFDAKEAVQKLNGFQVGGRYLILQYFQANKAAERAQQIQEMKKGQMQGVSHRT